jgi:hypothetical protein
MHLLDTTEVPTSCVVGRGQREGNQISFLFEYEDARFFNDFIWDQTQDTWSFQQTFEDNGQTKIFAEKKMVRHSDKR